MIGFMLDSARLLESRTYYTRFVDFIAQMGCDTLLWHFTDDQGCSLRFDSLPEAASRNAYTKQELRALLDHARDQGVKVIPELETLGHTRYITRSREELNELSENDHVFTSLCPVHPRTRSVIGALIDEVCELFDTDLVHAGLDEVNFGDHPLTREALKQSTPSDLFVDHVRFVHERLARHGKRMMMWGDHILKDNVIGQAIPKDILIGNWQYTAKVPSETTQRLHELGFEVVSCPAMISYDQPLAPGKDFALPNLHDTAQHARQEKTKGIITTIWTPQRFLPNALWPAVAYAAELMKHGPETPMDQAFSRYFEKQLKQPVSKPWADALCKLYAEMPMRKPWIAALRLELDERLDGVDLAERASTFASLRDQLRADRPDKDNDACCASIMLIAELLAHSWERAAAMSRDDITEQHLTASDRLSQQLSKTWDQDRFSDDPRKTEPVFPFDRDDHLIIAFGHGTNTLRHKSADED